MVGVRYTICHWAINRTDPQNLLSTTLDVSLQKCYNCEETSHLAARCSKPRKEKREKVKIVKEIREDFSLGRE